MKGEEFSRFRCVLPRCSCDFPSPLEKVLSKKPIFRLKIQTHRMSKGVSAWQKMRKRSHACVKLDKYE